MNLDMSMSDPVIDVDVSPGRQSTVVQKTFEAFAPTSSGMAQIKRQNRLA